MDFRQTVQPNSRSGAPSSSAPSPSSGPVHNDGNSSHGMHQEPDRSSFARWVKILSLVIVVGIAALLAALAIGFRHKVISNQEAQYVDTSKYQAVFLNNGQVYFGNIKGLTSKYVRMTNIYYLTQSDGSNANTNTSTNSNYSLVKLGCQQIHDPVDMMLINRDQITFWENLQDEGKVVDSIKKFKAASPNGPDCTQVSTETQASNSSTQGSTVPNTNGSNSSNK